MQIINESESLFQQNIFAYLELYAPNNVLIMDKFLELDEISTRELSWMIAIIKNGCSYQDIPWKDKSFRNYVEALYNIFHKRILDEIGVYEQIDEFGPFSLDKKQHEIYKKMGIRWEITHDCNGKGVPTYWITPAQGAWDSIVYGLLDAIGNNKQPNSTDFLQQSNHNINKLHQNNLAQLNLTTELLRGLRECCNNAPVTLDPERLPQAIWLKYLAHYLAISSKRYPDYGDTDYDDEKLINNAIGIHKLLREKLDEMFNIKLNERSLMLPEHREIADIAGILDIAVVAINPERKIPDDWSVKVTKNLALYLLKQLPDFKFLFRSIEADVAPSDENTPPAKIPSLPKPSTTCNTVTRNLYNALERVLLENPEHDLTLQAIFNTLLTKKDDPNYKIQSIQRCRKRSLSITFKCGHTTDLPAARQHTKKVIDWFLS